jgi:hypothetical protein
MIYRLSIWRDSAEHDSYEFFSSLAAAKRRCAELIREDGYERDELEIDHRPTPKGKKQVLDLLYYWASHADNG